MATPEPAADEGSAQGAPSAGRAARWPIALVLAAIGLAIVAGLVVGLRTGGPDGRAAPGAETEPEPVEVSSDAPRLAALDELVAAADAVVVGEVVATEPGRWFGDDASGRLRSRLVTLAVDEVVAGEGPRVGTVLVEEEGWSADGAPLIVDGAAPSAAGDRGVWFLVDPGDATTGAWITVGAQGRYLARSEGDLAGAESDDPLVAELGAETLEGLVARIRAVG